MAIGAASGRGGGFAFSPCAVLCVWFARVCAGAGGGGHGERGGVEAIFRRERCGAGLWFFNRGNALAGAFARVLATDALVIPTLFALPYPEMRSWVGLWNTWCFWVQFAGAVAVSGQRPLRVAGAYLVYWLASSALLFVFLLMFVSAGWFDVNELNANAIKMLETMRAQH